MLRTLITKNYSRYINLRKKILWRRFATVPNYNIDLKINNISLNKYVSKLQKEYQDLLQRNEAREKQRILELQPLIQILEERKLIVENLQSLQELLNDKDSNMRSIAEEEKKAFERGIEIIDEQIRDALLPLDNSDTYRSIILEVNAGVGGQEAMLFANELFEMYCNFAQYKGWEVQLIEYLPTDIGGIRHASAIISGDSVFRYFKYEAGVHRVQRIPATEKSGRVHTSTASVIALPQPDEIEVTINNSDLKIETKRSSGPGGQHVNTTDSAVRIVHLPTGLAVECQVDRSQIKNRTIAMQKLRALLYQKQLDSQVANLEAVKKLQVRSNFRNEKIRTYNFSQDRITDHRLQGCHFHNLKVFLTGGEPLENLIDKLYKNDRVEQLLSSVNSVKDE